MKITIQDNNNTVILENNDSMDYAKTRKLLDILFSVEPNRDSKRTPIVVSMEAENTEIPSVPVDPKQFGLWLNRRSPVETAAMLSSFVGADVTQYSNAHSLIVSVPQFANKLGYDRFIQAVEWLDAQGWVAGTPQLASLRNYYRKAIHLVALNA